MIVDERCFVKHRALLVFLFASFNAALTAKPIFNFYFCTLINDNKIP